MINVYLGSLLNTIIKKIFICISDNFFLYLSYYKNKFMWEFNFLVWSHIRTYTFQLVLTFNHFQTEKKSLTAFLFQSLWHWKYKQFFKYKIFMNYEIDSGIDHMFVLLDIIIYQFFLFWTSLQLFKRQQSIVKMFSCET